MRFLHTSDWHVGGSLGGRSRLAEQAAVLRELVDVARSERVDAVLVAGNLHHSAAPSEAARQLVMRTLLGLSTTGAKVVAIAGNHDHPAVLDGQRPLVEAAGITLVGEHRPARDGGLVEFTARSTGEAVQLAALPFLSRRAAVRAALRIGAVPAESYDDLIGDVLGELTAGFTADAVNLVLAHLTVPGAAFGGGERAAQSTPDYEVPTPAFPVHAHYVALGHLHRRQHVPAGCPVHYSGSPYPVDFAEPDRADEPAVTCLVEAAPGRPATVTDIPLRFGRRLRTVRGSVAALVGLDPGALGDALLRVYVREPARPGLREQVLELVPNAVEIRIDPEIAVPGAGAVTDAGLVPPDDRFAEYCALHGVDDPGLESLFLRLYDEASAGLGGVGDVDPADDPEAVDPEAVGAEAVGAEPVEAGEDAENTVELRARPGPEGPDREGPGVVEPGPVRPELVQAGAEASDRGEPAVTGVNPP